MVLSVWVPCFSVSCPVTQARASSTILSKSGKSEHFCLISYLKGKAFSLSFIEFDIVAQSFSCAQLFATPWTAAHQASLSFTISQNLLKLMTTDTIQPSHPLSSPSLLFRPNNIPLYGQIIFCSSMYQLVGICVASTLWLL